MDFFARARSNLFFCFFPARFSNSRTNWSSRHSSRQRISEKCGGASWIRPVLVCAKRFVVFERRTHADRAVLGWHGRRRSADFKYLAARHARHLLYLFSFLCQRRGRILRLPVRWNVA